MLGMMHIFYNKHVFVAESFVNPNDLIFSWEENPPVTNILGIFPDSFTSTNVNDYYEGEFVLSEPNSSVVLKIQLPEPARYFPIIVLGVGNQVEDYVSAKNVYAYTGINGKVSHHWPSNYICRANEDFFDGYFSQGVNYPIGYYSTLFIRILFEKAGVFRLRFHSAIFYK